MTANASPALVSSPWSRATAGLLTRDHRLRVPLDRTGAGDTMPDGDPLLTVYARELALPGDAPAGSDEPSAKPYLVFLQAVRLVLCVLDLAERLGQCFDAGDATVD